MAERPYICANGHQLSNGVKVCPRCGAAAKPARRDLWETFSIGLVVLVLAGGAAALLGSRGPGSPADDTEKAAAGPTTSTPKVHVDPSTTTAPATTQAAAVTTTTAQSTTTVTPATEPASSPTTTAPPDVAPPATTPATTPPVTNPPTRPEVPESTRRAIARDALVVMYTTGHNPPGYASMQDLVSPALRPFVDERTKSPGYRAAGCRQQVSRVLDGPGSGLSFGFSFKIDRTCDRVPMENGFRLPLSSGAYATVAIGPRPTGGLWATALDPS